MSLKLYHAHKLRWKHQQLMAVASEIFAERDQKLTQVFEERKKRRACWSQGWAIAYNFKGEVHARSPIHQIIESLPALAEGLSLGGIFSISQSKAARKLIASGIKNRPTNVKIEEE